MSCIKSIQRGNASGNQTIPINPVNPSKSIALITQATQVSSYFHENGPWAVRGVCTFTLTNTALIIENANWSYDTNSIYGIYSENSLYTWQVIEFA